MRGSHSGLTVLRAILAALAGLLIGYLAVLAAWPSVRETMPTWLQWLGRPNSAVTIAVISLVLIALAATLARPGHDRRTGAPVLIVVGLALTSAVLGVASYWRCQDDTHPDFFTPLIWTAGLVKGGDPARSLDSGACPDPLPVALDIAQLCALAAVFLSVIGVAVALFRSRLDRLRVYFARSVTAVVDLDDDASSMLAAIADTTQGRGPLVVVASDPDVPCVRTARNRGARILTADLSRPESLAALPIWRKLDRLYLLAPDPSTNVARLRTVTAALPGSARRIPLTVRIDDPWQAAAWRDEHLGGSDTHWAPDAVGRYEVTARRLLDEIIGERRVQRILVCGMSRLALALCADMSQRLLEQDYHPQPGGSLPRLTLVGPDAEEYLADHEHAREQSGCRPEQSGIGAVPDRPTVAVLTRYLTAHPNTAVILTDDAGLDGTTGTRLAARFPATPIYAYEPGAGTGADRPPVFGQLRTYRLSMNMAAGQAQDAWERAARLIHDRYVAENGGQTAAAVPWERLDEFYRGSNRRQVRNALRMVEEIGGHTWNTWGYPPDGLSTARLRGMEPLDALRCLGFDETTAVAMARAEHEDWCSYYRAAGWRYGEVRKDAAKIHDKLIDFDNVQSDPARLRAALASLVATLTKLRELGYRSRPASDSLDWQQFRRTGEVVAQRRDQPWSWTTSSGHTLRAAAGDWFVDDGLGGEHSVRDDIFRATHEHIGGDRWRRTGTVDARPARAGEVVDTLEGPATAVEGDWVVRGDAGECWPVPADTFAERYESVSPARPAGPDTR